MRSFLPSGWSPAYKFTVFEDAFLVLFIDFDASGMPIREDDGFHLARPVAAPRTAAAAALALPAAAHPHQLPTFELVWPLKMDSEFTRQVAHAFAELTQGRRPDKRKASELRMGELTSEVGHKLRRLSFDPS